MTTPRALPFCLALCCVGADAVAAQPARTTTGVTIVVEATKGETATSDAPAFEIFRKAAAYATPATPINF